MRITKGKKIMALLLAVLMVVGVMPMDWGTTKVMAKTVTNNIEIPADGLKAGTVYGDASLVSFEVLADMPAKADSAAEVDGVKYDFMVQGAANPKPNKGDIPTEGAAFKITAAVDSSITFVTKGAAKTYHFVDADKTNDVTGTEVPTGSLTFEMTAGKTYYFYLDGSKACVYGISYKYEQASDYQKEVVAIGADGFKAGETYGKAGLATFTVLADMPVKADSAATVDGVDYTCMVQGAANPKPNKGDIPTEGAAFKITAEVDSTITFVTKGAAKTYHFVDEAKTSDVTGTEVPTGSLKFDMKAGTTYYFYLDGSKACVYGITLEAGTPDFDWSAVAAPVLGTPTAEGTTITVPYTALIGDNGGEALLVEMYSGDTLVASTLSKAPGESGAVTFTATASGDYKFVAKLQREGLEDKTSEAVELKGYVLPLTAPTISTVTSKGNGKVEVIFAAVKDAEGYDVMYSKDGATYTTGASVEGTLALFEVSETGVEYSFKVVAKRGTETKESEVVKATVKAESQTTWAFSAFGQGVDTKNNGFEGNANDGKVTVYSEGGKGKIVPASTDGLAFYYTAVPSNLNFTLRAKVTVDKWTLSNGQDGFGMMAADRVGVNGDPSVFWNNSYMASATKVEYFYDTELNKVTTDTSATKITMKLGLGSQEKKGVTPETLKLFEANNTEAINTYFKTAMLPLETSAGQAAAKEETVYTNLFGNVAGGVEEGVTSPNAITEMYLSIQKNNTGYFVSYEDMAGNVLTQKYYETDTLEQLDKDNVYVGFYASRNARATFSDITFTTVAPENDAAKEERPIEKIVVNTSVSSATATGTPDYEFAFSANADGKLTITDSEGKVIVENFDITANVVSNPAKVELARGKNAYKLVFTPNADYVPGEYQVMESYEPIEINHTVTYKTYGSEGESLWVAPNATGTGSKSNPMSIYEAVKYVQPGQTIVVMEGTYLLDKTVKVERGIDGTADKKIYMIADPAAATRPVFDFQKNCAGMILAGDYWVFRGFDVTRSSNGQKGIQVSGNYNLLDSINTYYNGNTGIQISRYLTTDEFADWPAYNTILNCTSYGNADAGYEDADGFAAKLTCGDGNVFDGCIAHHNADDGWDLFAKVQSGSIGAVTIKNSVAYANGYLEDGTNAGNGNGFKMGGDSMSGKHLLENCVAYDNKAKGIDSNSGPDIIVKNCISFNNESYNVALYTNNTANTDYSVDGVISFRTKDLDQTENIKPKGTQDTAKIYKDTNYFWDPAAGVSVNTAGAKVSADWFVSLDTSVVPTRKADGTIDMHGLLELTDKAAAGAEGMGSGTASTPSEVPESIAPTTGSVANTKAEIEKLFGVNVTIELTIKDLVVNAEDAAKVEKVLPGKFKVGQYMDITLTKTTDGNTTNVTKVENGKVKVELVIPDALIADKTVIRTYKIVRLHDGVATVIDGSFDKATNKFTFETDSFSTYAIIYEDVAAPNTGDSTPVALYATFAFMSIVALAGVVLFERKRLAK